MSRPSKTTRARDAAVADLKNGPRDVRVLESHVRLLNEELDLLKRRESTNCDRKEVLAKWQTREVILPIWRRVCTKMPYVGTISFVGESMRP